MDTVEINGVSMDSEGFSRVTAHKEFANPTGSTRDPSGFAHSPNDIRQLQNWPASGFPLVSRRGRLTDEEEPTSGHSSIGSYPS